MGSEKAPIYGAALLILGVLQLVTATWGLRHRHIPLIAGTIAATVGIEALGFFERPDSDHPGLILGTIFGLVTAGLGAATLRQLRGASANLVAPSLPVGLDPYLGSPPPRPPRNLPSEIAALLRFEPTRALATPGIVATAIATATGIVWASWTLVYYRKDILNVSDDLRDNPLIQIVREFFNSDLINLLFERSFILQSALLAVGLMATPFLALFWCTDQTANDAHTHNMRFLLQRFDRRGLYFGRALSVTLGWWLLVWPLTFGASLLLASFDPKGFGSDHLMFALKTATLMGVYGTPFAAIMAAVNAMVSRPALAFSLTLGYWMLIGLGASLVENVMNKDADWISALFPTQFKGLLISPHLNDVLLGGGALALQAAVYLALGWVIFKRRDV